MLLPKSTQAFVQLFPSSWSRNMMKVKRKSRSILSINFCLYFLSSANANLAPTTRRGKMLQNQSGSLQEEQTLPMLPALSAVPCGTMWYQDGMRPVSHNLVTGSGCLAKRCNTVQKISIKKQNAMPYLGIQDCNQFGGWYWIMSIQLTKGNQLQAKLPLL